jgi:hypothetical protein
MSSLAHRAIVGTIAFAALAGAAVGQNAADFTIQNRTGFIITIVNVSASDRNEWGPDIPGRELPADNEDAAVSFEREESQCIFDIKATYDDDTETDVRGVDLCQTSTVEFTAPE